MTESMKYYESIRRKYPEAVSKDQFYQIAHISKATALHLLQNGLVPCKDTGKKTRRYTIRTDDIIFYLIDRELHPEVYRAPDRWYQERSGHYNSRVTYRNELTKLSEEERANFRKYMEDEFCQYGDLLTVVEVAEAIGYCDTSLHRWCNAKKLKSFNISGRFLIPKISLVDFLVSQYSFDKSLHSYNLQFLSATIVAVGIAEIECADSKKAPPRNHSQDGTFLLWIRANISRQSCR